MTNLYPRIKGKIDRAIRDRGIGNVPREFGEVRLGGKRKLLIVGPGEMPIPSPGWGAVETIINETLDSYEEAGFNVWLLNSKNRKEWLAAGKIGFDVILCHSDTLAARITRYFSGVPAIAISHYGYAAFPELWHKSYYKTLEGLKSVTEICCLSPSVEDSLKKFFPKGKTFVSPNGSAFIPELHKKKNGKFLSLGKVEVRKGQFDLYERFKDSSVSITFMGDIFDSRVEELINNDSDAAEFFTGGKSRIEIQHLMSEYSGLILLSKGEADALVLYEAQLAGLPIFATTEALGSQDQTLPWVKTISYDVTPEQLSQLAGEIKVTSEEISSYAQQNYRWAKRNTILIAHLHALAEKGTSHESI